MDRTTWLIVGVGLAWLLLTKKSPLGAAADAQVTFGPITAGDPPEGFWGNWCYVNNPWGGWSDASKADEASKYYVAVWGFDPPDEFRRYIGKMEPCGPKDITPELLAKFPPFPGRTMRVSELARISKQQAAFRAIKAQSDAEQKASCQQTANLIGNFVGTAGSAALTITGVGAPAAAAAGAAGKGLGALVGSFC